MGDTNMRRALFLTVAILVAGIVLAGFSNEVFAQQSIQIRVVDQLGEEIPGSVVDIPAAGVAGLPTGSAVVLADGVYTIVIHPAFDGQLVGLSRTELVEVYASTTDVAFEWITSDVEFSIVDQDGIPFDDSLLGFGNLYTSLAWDLTPYVTLTLPITDEGTYSTLSGSWADGYTTAFSPSGWRGALSRTELVEVYASTTDVAFEWITILCAPQLVDASGAPLPDAVLLMPTILPAWSPGITYSLPVTDGGSEISGVYADGYDIDVRPVGSSGIAEILAFEAMPSGQLQPQWFEIGSILYGMSCQEPQGPADLMAELVADIKALNLDSGISNSLDAKLSNAVKALEDMNENNDVAATNKLMAFIHEVQAQAGSKIPQEDADALIAQAQAIVELINA
jgi:hypothetical protein